ncbi:MAG: class I SAM-dependent methyltransferase [Planctomycetaceae bacterium]
MTIPVVLYVRTNLDWETLTEESFLRQEECANSVRAMSADQKQTLLHAIQLWNRTFGVSYFAYRQRLKEIAELNWTRIRNLDLVVRRQDLFTVVEHLDRFIVLPVDDDDWFHPDVADILRRHWRPDVDAFHWPDGLYRSVPFQDRFDQTAAQDRLVVRHWAGDFATNGYALTRTGVSRCNVQTRRRVLAFHWAAGKTFHQPGFTRCWIDQPLSASNKSLASATNLKALFHRADVVRNVPHLRRRTTNIPPQLRWTQEYVALTEHLNKSLCLGLVDQNASIEVAQPLRNRFQLLNYLIETRGYRSYLEIGCGGNKTFDAVGAPHKVGVDPQSGGTLRVSSDEFFRVNQDRFDLVIIDGLHLCEQVLRDVDHSLRCLRPGGCIVLHDCLPARREHQERKKQTWNWTGDVWKAVVALRQRPDCDVAVLNADWGLGVVLPRPNSAPLKIVPDLTWDAYQRDGKRLMRTMTFFQLQQFLGDVPARNCVSDCPTTAGCGER